MRTTSLRARRAAAHLALVVVAATMLPLARSG
ncbi:MAG: hypothetical protein JWN08_690, partial [Frankiales bacterium]|nr:hypothetical protein [Frankiales bacterium]